MQAPGVLDQGPLPGNGQRQEERVEPRIVEALADVAPGREQEAFLSRRDGGEPVTHVAAALAPMPPCRTTRCRANGRELAREVLEVVLALGQQDRRAPICEGTDDVVEDHRVARLVLRQRARRDSWIPPSVATSKDGRRSRAR